MAVVIADAWKQFPFVALLLLAGLQVIPHELYEAARVDGASRPKQFFKITLPLIKTHDLGGADLPHHVCDSNIRHRIFHD